MHYIEHRIGRETPEGSRPITILMTGFGPFREHVVNASWQTVRLIPERGVTLPPNIDGDTPVKLIIYEVPVIYKLVARIIPQLWEKHQPDVRRKCGIERIYWTISNFLQSFHCSW